MFDSCRMPEHFKSCVGKCKAFLVYDSHRGYQGENAGGKGYPVPGRKLHGRTGQRV